MRQRSHVALRTDIEWDIRMLEKNVADYLSIRWSDSRNKYSSEGNTYLWSHLRGRLNPASLCIINSRSLSRAKPRILRQHPTFKESHINIDPSLRGEPPGYRLYLYNSWLPVSRHWSFARIDRVLPRGIESLHRLYRRRNNISSKLPYLTCSRGFPHEWYQIGSPLLREVALNIDNDQYK